MLFSVFIGHFVRSLRPFLDWTANYGQASASLSLLGTEIVYRPLEVSIGKFAIRSAQSLWARSRRSVLRTGCSEMMGWALRGQMKERIRKYW